MSEDLIKRSDAVRAVFQKPAIHGSDGSWYHADDIKDALESVPSSDRPQGEWVTIDTEVVSVPVYWNEEQRQSDERGAGILEKCECSVCGWKKNFMGHKKLGVNKSYNYCPNCGARMRPKLQGTHFDSIIIDECAMKGSDDDN